MLSRWIIVGFVCCVLVPSGARADLYTAELMSVEWMVDSADEVYRVSVQVSNPKSRTIKLRPLASLKAGSPLGKFPRTAANHCRLAHLQPTPGSEWLMFVRGQDEEARIFRAIHLTNPLHSYRTAAISHSDSGEGLLRTKGEDQGHDS